MKFLSGIVATFCLSKAVIGQEVRNIKTEPGDVIVEWMRSKGGFLSEKVEFAALDKNDEKSPNGMFATSPIRKGEEILVVPTSTLIKPPPGGSSCDTARVLLHEYELKEESNYEPFVTYMFESFAYERNPSLWSERGKTLFNAMVGDDLLPPYGFGENTFENSCHISDDDEYDVYGEWLESAWSIVVSRGWTETLVPVFDMINHRNGHWHNVDSATSAHNGQNISVIALRDIEVGEQIHNSYNECHDIDCDGIAHTYTTPEMTMDYGFVEDYPRRFCFGILPDDDELVFELDIDEDANDEEEKVVLTWLSDAPESFELDWLKESLEHLHSVKKTVSNGANLLPSHEKSLLLEYYNVLKMALELAIETAESQEDETALGENEYDSLEAKRDMLNYELGDCGQLKFHNPETTKEVYNSHYQQIAFRHELESERTETCLLLSSYLQTCTSFRAHYHEFLVHYPASFLDNVKRVLFMGGGDNMIVHEILKYPNLELVVGMELDQKVVRSSFKHLATQPHFDKDFVQWWFGDASKSLHMLPSQYLGTFDLVLVDLQTLVVNSLMVTNEHSIMDYAMLLLKPDGVLMQNEDSVVRGETDFAQYTVDIELQDIPIICRQSINMGSNGVDFLRKQRKDHGIESLVYESIAKENDRDYESWWNYRHNTKKINEKMTSGDVDDSKTTEDQASANGFVIFLEVEGVGMPLDSPESLETVLSQVVKKAGLTKVSFSPLISGEENKPSETFIMMLKEGYISVEVWSQNSYCGFDIMFWSDFDKQEHIEKEIVGSIGGQSSSSYRVVTGGMHGVDSQSAPRKESNNESDVCYATNPTTTFEQSHMDVILQEFSSLDSIDSVTAVLCFDQQKPCKSLDSLRKDIETNKRNTKVVPLWPCNALPERLDDTYESMGKCKNDLVQDLEVAVESTGKINRLIIDPEVPQTVGQILHKIMVDTQIRKKVLSDQFIILAPTFNVDESWRKHLLDRFRTEFLQFSPAHLAEVYVSDASTTEQMKIEVFSSLHKEFYSNLVGVVKNSEKKTGLTLDVKDVKDGILNWTTDKPEVVVTNEDYDNSSAFDQWKTQRPLGSQTIFQFDIRSQLPPLLLGQRVLVNHLVDIWIGEWVSATISSCNDDGTYDVIYEESEEEKENVPRNLIRRWETEEEADSKLSVKDRVLYSKDDEWFQGLITKTLEDGKYELQSLYSEKYTIRYREDLMTQMEPVPMMEQKEMSFPVMEKLLESTPVVKESMTLHKDNIDGFVLTGGWKEGRVIIVWNGEDHFDLNLFTYDDGEEIGNLFQDVFLSIESLTVSSRDEQPRGFGQVMNLKRDMHKPPHWVSSIEMKL